jgi:hypothetical protein
LGLGSSNGKILESSGVGEINQGEKIGYNAVNCAIALMFCCRRIYLVYLTAFIAKTIWEIQEPNHALSLPFLVFRDQEVRLNLQFEHIL